MAKKCPYIMRGLFLPPSPGTLKTEYFSSLTDIEPALPQPTERRQARTALTP